VQEPTPPLGLCPEDVRGPEYVADACPPVGRGGFSSLLDSPLGFQIIFPEGRNVSQPLNDGREMFDDVIHLFFRTIDGKAETDRSMCRGEWNPHGPEDMRRLQ